ncbi:MAG: phosphodiester glycosidase family protein, partial [Gemmataceae bacterium]|nr:phosphodiester glycosidase family protein [Gemmataceae bacterium]
ERTELGAKDPRPMRGHAVRIDLTADGVRFVTTRPADGKPEKTLGLKTSSFLAEHKCQVAINGSAFTPVRADEGQEQDIDGLHVSAGAVVSKGNGKYDALLIAKDNKAWVARPPFELKNVHHAVGGFQIVLENGNVPEKLPDYNKGTVHPRSAAGISKDGKALFLLVIDGRQDGFSEGATIQEVGGWLKKLGAADGINLDGGGTTTLVVEAGGRPKVLNRPIHANKPGTERVSGSHLGVFAKPLAPPKP